MDIDTTEAGREMDALIAEKVMGLRVYNNPGEYAKPFVLTLIDGESDKPPFRDGQMVTLPSYSTDIGAAWEIVSKLTDNTQPIYHTFTLSRYGLGVWGYRAVIGVAYTMGKMDVEGIAKTAPLAICRAAAKAVANQP